MTLHNVQKNFRTKLKLFIECLSNAELFELVDAGGVIVAIPTLAEDCMVTFKVIPANHMDHLDEDVWAEYAHVKVQRHDGGSAWNLIGGGMFRKAVQDTREIMLDQIDDVAKAFFGHSLS